MSFPQDVSLFRDQVIQMNDLQNVDVKYTFFYDETNNPKKFRITTEGFNVNENEFLFLEGLHIEVRIKFRMKSQCFIF